VTRLMFMHQALKSFWSWSWDLWSCSCSRFKSHSHYCKQE